MADVANNVSFACFYVTDYPFRESHPEVNVTVNTPAAEFTALNYFILIGLPLILCTAAGTTYVIFFIFFIYKEKSQKTECM